MRLCFMRSNGSRGGGRGLGDRQGESCASGGLVNRRRRLPPATGTGMSSGCFMCRRTASTPPRWPLLPGPRDSYMNPASNPSRLQGLTFRFRSWSPRSSVYLVHPRSSAMRNTQARRPPSCLTRRAARAGTTLSLLLPYPQTGGSEDVYREGKVQSVTWDGLQDDPSNAVIRRVRDVEDPVGGEGHPGRLPQQRRSGWTAIATESRLTHPDDGRDRPV